VSAADEASAARKDDAIAAPAGADSTPDTVDGVAAFALYGEPLFKLPQDLYIPPDALEVFLETFEGPLDLLLYLIRKQNFNVLDIPMAQVTAQYLGYVDQIRTTNLELAAEYLLMAAMLIEIKSRMLLPVKKADTGEEAEDPRAELVRRLLEYEQMKLAAQRLDQLPQLGRDFLRAEVYIEQSITPRFPDVNADDLRAAWADVLKRAKLVQHHKISREELSVREHMSLILRRLQNARFMEFAELFDVARRAGGRRELHRHARARANRSSRSRNPNRSRRSTCASPTCPPDSGTVAAPASCNAASSAHPPAPPRRAMPG
jgi:segregation and condensation protein A